MKKPLLLGLMINSLGAADLELAEVTVSPPQDIRIDMETEAVPKAFLKPSPCMSAAAAALFNGDGEGERMLVKEMGFVEKDSANQAKWFFPSTPNALIPLEPY